MSLYSKADTLVIPKAEISSADAWWMYRLIYTLIKVSRAKFMRVYDLLRKSAPPLSIREIHRRTGVRDKLIRSIAMSFGLRTAKQIYLIAKEIWREKSYVGIDPVTRSIAERLLMGEVVELPNNGRQVLDGSQLSYTAIASALGLFRKQVAEINQGYCFRSRREVKKISRLSCRKKLKLSTRAILALWRKKDSSGRFLHTIEDIADQAGCRKGYIYEFFRKRHRTRTDPKLHPRRFLDYDALRKRKLARLRREAPATYRRRQLILEAIGKMSLRSVDDILQMLRKAHCRFPTKDARHNARGHIRRVAAQKGISLQR